ncbi:hypothetical protein [Nocardia sp. NPDC050710]|uniref:hypothetical protein n=1 Tax=Nocardia sp. NPDC050710 TaxID=3157220 RepID=UPI0033DD3BC5
MRKLGERLGDGRNLVYTLPQLWYAASRAKMPDLAKRFNGWRIGVYIPLVAVTFFAMVSGAFNRFVVLGTGIVALVVADLALRAVRPRFLRTSPVRMPVPYDRFRKEVVGRWSQVYGGPPPGAVDEGAALPPAPQRPRFAVLCPDRGVLTCLAANNVSHTWGMVLADRIDRLPPELPVLVLHDASLPGVLFASRAREALGSRAVQVGLAPRALLGKEKPLRLRDGHPEPSEVARLHREPLSEAEIVWLAEGWWSPLAAVPPAKLLAALGSAVHRVEEAGDPDRRRARAVGFLTWPTG